MKSTHLATNMTFNFSDFGNITTFCKYIEKETLLLSFSLLARDLIFFSLDSTHAIEIAHVCDSLRPYFHYGNVY